MTAHYLHEDVIQTMLQRLDADENDAEARAFAKHCPIVVGEGGRQIPPTDEQLDVRATLVKALETAQNLKARSRPQLRGPLSLPMPSPAEVSAILRQQAEEIIEKGYKLEIRPIDCLCQGSGFIHSGICHTKENPIATDGHDLCSRMPCRRHAGYRDGRPPEVVAA